ncbi:MAG: SDR family oxidoreductase [Balneolales bacterium]
MSHKKILLTGASRGIGYQTALLLADQGHHVIAVARSFDKLQELSHKAPGKIIPIKTDLSDTEDISKLVKEVESLFQTVDVVIHNAGGIKVKPFEELTDDDWQYHLDINYLSAVKLYRGVLPLLDAGSHILSISSMGGFQGASKFTGLSAYSVSKGALTTLTECLATELSHREIAVNCLCLGAVQTEMLEKAFPGIKAPVSASQMAEYIAEFGLTGHRFFNGKILPVALSDPE